MLPIPSPPSLWGSLSPSTSPSPSEALFPSGPSAASSRGIMILNAQAGTPLPSLPRAHSLTRALPRAACRCVPPPCATGPKPKTHTTYCTSSVRGCRVASSTARRNSTSRSTIVEQRCDRPRLHRDRLFSGSKMPSCTWQPSRRSARHRRRPRRAAPRRSGLTPHLSIGARRCSSANTRRDVGTMAVVSTLHFWNTFFEQRPTPPDPAERSPALEW